MTPTAATDVSVTIDELAAATGSTVRTIRFYAAQGLLPPPERRGRLAYYGAQHRMRLDLIRQLQEHGYTLAAIGRALERIPLDATAAEFALQAALLAPWGPEHTEELDRATIDRRAGRRLSDDELDLLIATRGVQPVGTNRYRTTSALLSMGLEFISLPVPAQLVRESSAVVADHAAAVAKGLTDVFRRQVWEPFRRGEADTPDHRTLAAIVARLRPLAIQALVHGFELAADQAARRTVEDEPPADPDTTGSGH